MKGRNLKLYPDADMRLSTSRAVALETSRGWRIAKEKQSHKIDVVIALAMAALVAVSGGQRRWLLPHIVRELADMRRANTRFPDGIPCASQQCKEGPGGTRNLIFEGMQVSRQMTGLPSTKAFCCQWCADKG